MINDSESMQKQYSKGIISIHGICVGRPQELMLRFIQNWSHSVSG